MISFKEMIKGMVISDVPIAHQQNIQELLNRLNVLREAWGKPMKVTSGYRTTQDQLRIYRGKGVSDDRIPFGSQHLKGAACDIYDPDLSLTKWLKENKSERLVEVDLYCESGNLNWVHFQLYPPKSGNRWFLP